jgi:hypothetical protein
MGKKREPKVKLTGKVVDLQGSVECASIGATVVDGDTRSHDAGLAQTGMDIGDGRPDSVQGILGACAGILFGPVDGNLAIQIDTLGHAG